MALSSYKQWSGAYRARMQAQFNAALRGGNVPEPYRTPKPCEICGQTHNTMLHQEEYGPTLADYLKNSYWVCGRCHTMVHLRYRFPGRWAAYKEQCRRQGPQPTIPHMGVLFGEARSWYDIPVVKYAEGDTWWEKLTTERYTGPIIP